MKTLDHTLLTLLALAACTPAAPATDPSDPAIDLDTTINTTDLDATIDPTTSTTTDPEPSTTTDPGTSTTTTTDPETTTETTLDPETTTTAPSPTCGDAHVDPGEMCDHGPGNGNNNSCTAFCQYAVCGDRLVDHGSEQCDLGVDNNSTRYDWCDENCQRTNFCGDEILHPSEECDAGANNGTGTPASLDGVPCSQTCHFEANRVFLTSVTFTAEQIGSAAAADGLCQQLAAAVSLDNANNFHAWISDDESTPLERFGAAVSGYPYALADGARVAADRDALVTTGPELGITRTELGTQIFDATAWTNTAPDGQLFDPQQDCGGWENSSALKKARVGRSGIADATPTQLQQWQAGHQWTSHATLNCTGAYHLYCFEG